MRADAPLFWLMALGLAACEPSDGAYAAAARARVTEGCCNVGDGKCTKCPLLQDAKVVSSHVQACCAGAGALVHLDVSGPSGPGECTFNVMKMNGGLDANMGGCHAN